MSSATPLEFSFVVMKTVKLFKQMTRNILPEMAVINGSTTKTSTMKGRPESSRENMIEDERTSTKDHVSELTRVVEKLPLETEGLKQIRLLTIELEKLQAENKYLKQKIAESPSTPVHYPRQNYPNPIRVCPLNENEIPLNPAIYSSLYSGDSIGGIKSTCAEGSTLIPNLTQENGDFEFPRLRTKDNIQRLGEAQTKKSIAVEMEPAPQNRRLIETPGKVSRPEPTPCEFPCTHIPGYHLCHRQTDSRVILIGTVTIDFTGPTDKSRDDVVVGKMGTTWLPTVRRVRLKKKSVKVGRAVVHTENGHCVFVTTHETCRYRRVANSHARYVEEPGTSPGLT